MKILTLLIFVLIPSVVLAQKQVGPEGYKLFWIAAFILLFVAVKMLSSFIRSKKGFKPRSPKSWFKRKRLEVELTKDRLVRPKVLTLKVKNTGARYVDIEAPVLVFRKLWSIRKFRLKKVKNEEIYPLYLEVGKTFTLTIELSRFFEHDRKLKRFYWGRVILEDVDGRRFKTKYVSLRKSLYT
ncbi:MAG: hypothetical protein RBS73_16970 [Prolixibacteraceae bacterium]|jgi:hypothetical protein|nr:hypothetical protein [Prolixibacteraceae bacterium]